MHEPVFFKLFNTYKYIKIIFYIFLNLFLISSHKKDAKTIGLYIRILLIILVNIRYHIPRAFLNSSGNLLVLLEESGGDPLHISLDTVSRTGLQEHASRYHPPQ
jgi:hypothetical protein